MGNTLIVKAISAASAILGTAVVMAAPAQAKELGGVNVQGWCTTFMIAPQIADPARPLNTADAYSWRCWHKAESGRNGGKPWAFSGVDMNAACRWQYNNNKAWAKPLNPQNAYTWRCNV